MLEQEKDSVVTVVLSELIDSLKKEGDRSDSRIHSSIASGIEALNEGGTLILDMRDADSLGFGAVSLLVSVYNKAKLTKKNFKIITAPGCFLHLIKICNLGDTLGVKKTSTTV